MPGSNWSVRNPATRSFGFSHQRKMLTTSLMCAASKNFRPPYLTNGMLRRLSSISSWALCCDALNSTAWSFNGTPFSLARRICFATYRASAASSAKLVRNGFWLDLRSDHKLLVNCCERLAGPACRRRKVVVATFDGDAVRAGRCPDAADFQIVQIVCGCCWSCGFVGNALALSTYPQAAVRVSEAGGWRGRGVSGKIGKVPGRSR